MATTLMDIARAAGVGEGTVGRALRGKGSVRPSTRERILKIAQELNYQPNHIARSLALGRSDLLGFIASAGDAATLDPYLEAIEQGIRDAGYSMLFYMSSSSRPNSEREIFREVIGKRVAGAIIEPNSLASDPEPYEMLISNGVKIVIINRSVEGIKVPQIVYDHYLSARLATEHLISLGHTDIIYLAIPETSYVGRERGRGFRDAMKIAGISLHEFSIVETGYTEQAGYQMAMELIEKHRPTAFLARQDIVAAGAMQAVLAAGLSVPGDISIVGQGDMTMAHALLVPLTTIHNPREKMASVAIETLLNMLSGRRVKPVIKALETTLVVRSSTAPPRKVRPQS